jgi:hypothetical protein
VEDCNWHTIDCVKLSKKALHLVAKQDFKRPKPAQNVRFTEQYGRNISAYYLEPQKHFWLVLLKRFVEIRQVACLIHSRFTAAATLQQYRWCGFSNKS